MYPKMLEAAKAEGNKEAERSFYYANEVEKIHAQLYQKLLDNLGTAKETYAYYVCPVCGYTSGKEPPDSCPVCGTKGKMFKKID
jgi:rubrerythrin